MDHGGGWDEYHFKEQKKPLRGDLDAAAPNNPVVLTRAGGHSSVGNSKALQMADINPATPDPERGLIEKDPNGKPNGVIRERTISTPGWFRRTSPPTFGTAYLRTCAISSSSESRV